MFFEQQRYRVTSSLMKQVQVFRADYSSFKVFRSVVEAYGEFVRIKDSDCQMPKNWTPVILWFARSTRQPIALQHIEKTSFLWIITGYCEYDLRVLGTRYQKSIW